MTVQTINRSYRIMKLREALKTLPGLINAVHVGTSGFDETMEDKLASDLFDYQIYVMRQLIDEEVLSIEKKINILLRHFEATPLQEEI